MPRRKKKEEGRRRGLGGGLRSRKYVETRRWSSR
jgi:hypothetical protein